MTTIPWIQSGERVVGRGHPTLTDVDNRPLRTLLQLNGFDPDGAFSGVVGPVFHMKSYGAAGDGVADDYDAWVEAKTAAAPVKGIVYFSYGTYKVRATLQVPASVGIRGDSKVGSIILAGVTNMGGTGSNPGAIINVTSANSWVDNIQIKGSNTSDPGERGVDVSNADVHIHRCRFYQLSGGVRYSGAAADRGRVEFCDFIEMVGTPGQSEGYGIQVHGGSWHTVTHNYFKDISRHAIYISGGTGYGVCDSIFTHNQIDTVNSSHAIQMYQPDLTIGAITARNLIAHNRIRLNNSYSNCAGIVLYGNCRDNVVQGNVIDGLNGYSNTHGIEITSGVATTDPTYRALRNMVEGNHVTNLGGTSDNHCILILNADDTSIRNNDCFGAATSCYGVYVYTNGTGDPFSRRTRISGNNIHNCTRPVYLVGANVEDTIVGINYYYNNTTNYLVNTATRTLATLTPSVSADRGDTSPTLDMGSETTQRFDTTLTVNRTVTLPSSNAFKGAKFRVVRTGLGAFTLDVGGLKTIPSATAAYVDVEYNGSAWQLAGYGAL